MSKTYTNAEILDRLKSLEGLLLERVFETSYSESLRTYDLIDHLRSKAHDLGLEGEDTYAALIQDLEKLSSTIGGLINGKRGELLAAKSLKCLRGDSLLLSNIALPNGDSFEEYDQVLIARSGVYVIEVKNYRNDVVIDDGGILRCGPRSYNVGERMREKMHALWDAIQFSSDGCMSEEDVNGMLLFVNNEASVTDFFHRVPVMRCGQIVYSIEDANRCEEKLSWEDMVRIKSVLLARKTAAEFPMPLDENRVKSELEDFLDLVEAKTAKNAAKSIAAGHNEVDSSTTFDNHARHSQLPSWVPAVAAVISGLAIGAGGLFLHAKKG
ncbi:nuclease-related domain-containing protein [Collinsella sp. AF25-2LB]|uniref:nuclease-related domain-containing protein n=1 Tax=Collinsella sp. AF25-2LB TaxID=2292226 RepID=UPI000E485279|nr:nuclease-related domain-containing protein [Collinsella sp. AF25-2LB]RGR37809.1 NERD domain-containing protein [Collinsella sp. AF25-2LB]